jgi:vancomycin resistance protein YoaR
MSSSIGMGRGSLYHAGRRGRPTSHAFPMLVVAVVVVTLVAVGFLYLRALEGRILFGVRTLGVPVGGLTPAEARQLLGEHLAGYLAAPVVLRFEDCEWRPTAAEIGLHLDLEATIERAFARGRVGSLAERLAGLASAVGMRSDVPVVLRLDRARWLAYLHDVAKDIDRPARDARLEVRGVQVVMVPAQEGRRLDVEATAAELVLPSAEARTQEIALRVVPLMPSLREADLLATKERAERLLAAAPLTLTYGPRTWTLTQAQLARLLVFTPPPAGAEEAVLSSLHVALDEKATTAYLTTIARQIDRPPADPTFRWDGTRAVLVKPAQDGLELDIPSARQLILERALAGQRTIELPVVAVKPRVMAQSGEELGITGLVGRGRSTYRGSIPERAWNIQLAASRISGALVAPGETFSFLKRLGPITKENGYKEGYVIKGNETVKDDGGGVCQVSTTLFRAVFWSGLPIIERHQHTYRVGFYEQDGSPAGFDAAVYDPGVDFKFKNETSGWLLIEAVVDQRNSVLTFNIYGTKPDWVVEMPPPILANRVPHGPPLPDGVDPTLPVGVRKQVEWAVDGVDATIIRIVRRGDEVIRTDRFFSRFVPWREKWVVGTKEG